MAIAQPLSHRQETILDCVLTQYVETAAPVSSDVVKRWSGLEVSAATVRNEMAALEDAGYLSRAHHSAGAMPTDYAYRYAVERLAGMPDLAHEEKASLRRQMAAVGSDIDEGARVSARLLAGLAGNLSLVSLPRTMQTRVRHLQLVALDELLVMQVLVLQEARLRKDVVRLEEPVTEAELATTAARLNGLMRGRALWEMRRDAPGGSPLERAVLATTARILEDEDNAALAEYIVEGLRNLVEQPEFNDGPQVRLLIDALESRRLAEAVLTERPGVGEVRVVIGQENHEDALKPMSLVITRYGVEGQVFGTVSIIGPMRMRYRHTIAGVHYVALLMSGMLEDAGIAS